MSVSPTQILIIALVIFLLFGASRLADLGKGLGEGIKNFKKGLSDEAPPEKPRSGSPQLSTRENGTADEQGDDKGQKGD